MRKLKTMDGNAAAAHVAYAFSEVAAIYPITPSSPMAENMDEWVSQDRTNIFGEKVKIVEMQSEAGAAGAVHGAIAAGALTSTFTASQGLLLMIPNMYKLAGEQTPTVFHVAARCVATHALNIFGDHSDVMGCRQTGFAMLASNSVQQAMDLAAVAHLSAIGGHLPMLHFFDGFRTSHEQQKIETWDYEDLKEMVDWDALKAFKDNALHPNHPHTMGSAEQPETFFQHREACNVVYNETPDLVNEYMQKVNAKIGTDYKPFNYYGAPDATEVIVAMGSVCECAEEVIDYLNAKGKKVGIIEVHLYRPWSNKYLFNVMPKTVKKIAVLDRTKEMGATGEPLYLDVCSVIRDADTLVIGGRYGMGSKDTTPQHIKAVYDHLNSDNPFTGFTIGIKDDVTHLSLPDVHGFHINSGVTQCLFYGLGSDGTVSANKSSIKIIGDNTDLYCQAYFAYDSKKAGGATRSNLRFGNKPIRATYYVNRADFISCSLDNYCLKYDMLKNLKDGGRFLLNTEFTKEEIADYLPNRVRVLSSEKEGKMEPDLVTQAPDVDLDLTVQEKEEIINWKMSGTSEDTDKMFGKLFLKQCHQLHDILPGLFEADSDYMELLFGISYTNKDDVIYMLVNPETGIPEADFNVSTLDEEGNPTGQVEIIGWLYQYYNTELKDDTFAKLKKNVKITKERIPAATQLFTPDWIVRYMVENSVGRIWIEHLRAVDPSTDEKATAERFGWKYYLPEAEQEEAVNVKLAEIRTTYKDLKPTDISCIDPCMGSGHILIAMFDVLMGIYESAGYDKREAAFDIVEHNIHGLDIDQRAYQLAYFAVMMKGRGYNRRFLRGRDGKPEPKVYAIVESNEINRNHLQFFGTHLSEMERNLAVMQIEGLLDTFKDAREYGSILNVDACDWDVLERFVDDLAWDTEVWIAEAPDHMIHLNGDRFYGPR